MPNHTVIPAACQNTLSDTAIKVGFGSQKLSLASEVYSLSLLYFLLDAVVVERPCEVVSRKAKLSHRQSFPWNCLNVFQ